MRRFVAIVLVIALLGPVVGVAQQQVVTCPVDGPAPAVGVPMIWQAPPPAGDAPGVWFPDAKVVAIDQRLTGCEEKLGTCSFDLAVEQAKTRMPAWVWVLAGVGVGALVGFGAGAAWKAAQ